MSKVRTFSQTFPSYHPRAGEPTFFVEKFHWGFWQNNLHPFASASEMLFLLNKHLPEEIIQTFVDSLDDDTNFEGIEKHHTIREGHHFKIGDWFSPRVWSGKPYNSKQIIIAPDIQVKKIWDVEIDEADIWAIGLPDTQIKYTDNATELAIAKNDGLSEYDFYHWFYPTKKPWIGQIICWNENIEY